MIVGERTKTRITFGREYSDHPLWLPDGKTLIFGCGPAGQFHVCRKAADGTGSLEKLLVTPETQEMPTSVSPDGRFVAYMRADGKAKTGWDIWVLPLSGDGKPFSLVTTEFLDASPAVSPDGKWMAYNNNESGRQEIYVQPFPGRPTAAPFRAGAPTARNCFSAEPTAT